MRDFLTYEVLHKTNSFSFLQCQSFMLLVDLIEVDKNEKLKPKQIDSIFSIYKLKRIDKSKCESVSKVGKKEYNLFQDLPIYNIMYNGSSDTITIQNEINQKIITRIAPKNYYISQLANGTSVQVLINGNCKAKYITRINSYLYYEE